MGSNTLIIIPAFNEEKNIGTVIESIKKYLPAQILVVNDGSGDKTEEIAKANGAWVANHPFNLGYGVALQTGFKYAIRSGYEYACTIDGDGQHDPSHIRDLLKVVESGDADVVVGSRFMMGDYNAPFFRKIGMRIFGTLASVFIRQKITDPTSGYQALNRKVLLFCSGDRYPVDYPDADVIIMLHRSGFRIMEIPVRMHPSSKNKSMHGGLKPLYYVFKMFFSIFLTLLRKEKY